MSVAATATTITTTNNSTEIMKEDNQSIKAPAVPTKATEASTVSASTNVNGLSIAPIALAPKPTPTPTILSTSTLTSTKLAQTKVTTRLNVRSITIKQTPMIKLQQRNALKNKPSFNQKKS
jgi:hypothetical protein